jgi:hypothetical protein
LLHPQIIITDCRKLTRTALVRPAKAVWKKNGQMDQKLESTACDLKHVFISVSKDSSQKAKLPGCQQWGYNNRTNNSQV